MFNSERSFIKTYKSAKHTELLKNQEETRQQKQNENIKSDSPEMNQKNVILVMLN